MATRVKKYQTGGSAKFDSTKKYPGTPPKSLKPKVSKEYYKLRDDYAEPGAKKREAEMIKELKKKGSMPASKKNVGKGGIKVKAKAKGGKEMIKRADGSYSQRGLWDNLRKKAAQNKKTGAKPKAPTKAMLTQERKIKAKGK